MTEFRSYPTVRFDMPTDGKVTGTARLLFRGDGSVMVTTDGAHVNDDNPAIDYRGESFLVSVDYTRQADGSFAVTDYTDNGRRWSRVHITRRANWSDAPPSFCDAIVRAIADHLPNVWTPELERAGLEATVAQRLHSLEREESETAAKLREIRAEIRRERKRLPNGGAR